jgi:hypothetical protein
MLILYEALVPIACSTFALHGSYMNPIKENTEPTRFIENHKKLNIQEPLHHFQ